MSTQKNLRQDKDVRQDLNLAESKNRHINLLASTTDFYTEWTTENKSVEKDGNLAEVSSDKAYPRRNITNKHKIVCWKNDTNDSAYYNEICNRAELYNFP